MFKKSFIAIGSLFIAFVFASFTHAENFNLGQDGTGVIFVGDHKVFSFKDKLKKNEKGLTGVTEDHVLVFDNGNVKKELDLKNVDSYKAFEDFCWEQGYFLTLKFVDLEGSDKILVIRTE